MTFYSHTTQVITLSPFIILEDLTGLDDIHYQELHYQFEDSDFDDITSNEFKGESPNNRTMKLS